MLIDKFQILWLRFQREDKHFRLSFPISLYIFQELLDCTLDLFEFAYFFTPEKKQKYNSAFSVQGARTLVQHAINLFDSLSNDESYYIFDVKTNKIKVSAEIM